MNKSTMIKSEKGFTMDTCAIINICENPNIASLLACRIDFGNSPVYLNSVTVHEAKKKGFELDEIISILKMRLGVSVLYEPVTASMYSDASALERNHDMLHWGDSQILAFNISKSATLITCDRNLVKAAGAAGSNAVNPDVLPCDALARPRLHRPFQQALA